MSAASNVPSPSVSNQVAGLRSPEAYTNHATPAMSSASQSGNNAVNTSCDVLPV
jgi:hypothetical protein